MTDLETLLADRLESRADHVPVGPVPVDRMLRAAASRRRRPVVVLAAAAAVAVVAVGLAAVVPGSESGEAPPAAPSPSGARTVGEGRVVLDIPAGITDDQASARVLVGADRASAPIPGFRGGVTNVVIDGSPAVRYPAMCDLSGTACRTWVDVPSEQTVVVIKSSEGPDLAYDLAARVRVLRDAGIAMKRVGIGHLSVEVPETWSRDVRSACGTPTEDTLVTRDGSRACLDSPVAGVESVRVLDEEPLDSRWDPVDLGGVLARRSEGWCDQPAVPTCSISIWVPEAGVGLLVTSHTDMESALAILDTVSYDPGLIAVPASYRTGSGVPLDPDAYEEVLDESGLIPEMLAAKLPAGLRVADVVPDVGTMVPLGSTVQFHVEPWRDSDKGRS